MTPEPTTRSIGWMDSLVTFASRHRLRGAARLRHLLRGNHPVSLTRVRTRDGLVFNLDLENVLDACVAETGYFEREVLDAILTHLPTNGVVWDVGANIGLHAITTKRLRPDATVIAFEPAPFTAAELSANAALNSVDVRLVAVALGDRSGYAPLSVVVRGNSGLTSLKPWSDVAYESTVVCRCERAADLVAGGVVPAPSVVKLDVEGFEYEVLSGFADLLSPGSLHAVVLEAPADLLDRPGPHPIRALLASRGFDLRPLPPAEPQGWHPAANFLALPVPARAGAGQPPSAAAANAPP